VAEAGREYRAEQDDFAAFVSERCTEGGETLGAALLAAYTQWGQPRGIEPVKAAAFNAMALAHGYTRRDANKGVMIGGLSLR
jgi:phage/plasmid-associated DNA primase